MLIFNIFLSYLLFYFASGSSLTKPPQSALVIAFEKHYEQSLLAYTLSDQGIDTTLVVSSGFVGHLYESLQGIEIIRLNSSVDGSVDKKALYACESLLSDENVQKRIREIQPHFVIFPALRHDACLLPWTKFINSIPVIVAYGPEEDIYAVQRTHIALPIHRGGLWSGFWSNADSRSIIAQADRDYVTPALKLVKQHVTELQVTFEELYSEVELILSGGDSILRSDFALLSERFVEIGCHHCRGAYPLPSILQKELVEFRLGSIVATLDESFVSLIEEIARKLPQGRQGQAVAWKNHKVKIDEDKRPPNLFVHGEVDRQDLVGYARARVLLSHCTDVELLETAFHGTPVICFPRNFYEQMNALRATELGFSLSTNGDTSVDAVVTAIENIHKTSSYREVARGYSVLMRDRALPPSDRLLYWLGFLGRNAEREIKLAVPRANTIRTFAGDSHLLSGLIVGTLIGVALTLVAAFFWFNNKTSHKQTRKDKKFDR